MTNVLKLKRIAILLIFVFALGYVNVGATAFAASKAPQTVAYFESDGSYVAFDGADAQAIAGRLIQSSVDNGYVYVFSTVKNPNVETALKMLDKEVNVSDKTIKNIKDIDAVVLNQASEYLQSQQFSVTRIELEEKSHETSDQKWQKWLGYAAGVAAIVSLFKK